MKRHLHQRLSIKNQHKEQLKKYEKLLPKQLKDELFDYHYFLEGILQQMIERRTEVVEERSKLRQQKRQLIQQIRILRESLNKNMQVAKIRSQRAQIKELKKCLRNMYKQNS